MEKSITQDDLAAKARVSKSTISQAERACHRYPPKDIIQSRLATALGISLAEFRAGPKDNIGENVATESALTRDIENCRSVHYVAPSEYNQGDIAGIQLPTKWIRGATDEPDSLTYVVVSDTAMQPTVKVGDIAMLEPFTSIAPGLYLVGERHGDSLSVLGIRRVMPTPTGKTRFSCDNERFSSEHGELTILAKVLFIVQVVVPE